MKKNYNIQQMQPLLGDYLKKYHHVDISHTFKCLNPKCGANNMSYSSKFNICKCFSCNKKYDIFELVAQDYQIDKRCFVKQIKKILELYPNLDDSH